MAPRLSALPSLNELGRDLLEVSLFRRVVSLCAPFLFAGLFFVFAAQVWWLPALGCAALVSFLTYGSISHDLVHRTLRLPFWLNELLLTLTELLTFRSGHAYRVSHLHHHARFPAADDLEAAAARMSLPRALLDGVTLQFRLFAHALRKPGAHRRWVAMEGALIILLLAGCFAALPWMLAPAIYAALVVAGSWVFPIVTVWIPHDAGGRDPLTQTRLFRGWLLSLLALEHLYHLEHHLYPQVPHQNWPKLAHRLDPFFSEQGIRPIKLLF